MELCWLKCCLACPLTHFPASVLVTNSVSVKLNTQAALVSSIDGWQRLTAVYLWSTAAAVVVSEFQSLPIRSSLITQLLAYITSQLYYIYKHPMYI